MAKKQRKNTYRVSFTIDGAQRDLFVHTTDERDQVKRHIKRLLSSKRTGAPCLESEEWAAKLPKNSNVKEFLIRWKVIQDTSDQERTLEDLYQVFVTNARDATRTISIRKNALDRLYTFFGSDCLLRTITRQKADEYYNFLLTKGNKQTGGGLAQNSLTTDIKRCKQFFKYALEEGWIKENPFSRFTATYKPCTDRWQYISKEDVIRVIERTPNVKYKVLIALIRFCGLRGASELKRLTFDESCLHLSTDKRHGEIVVHSTKVERHAGHEQRTIPLTPFVEGLIRDLWETIPEGENRFFYDGLTNPGGIVKKIFKRFGVELGQMYNLRRSYATDLMAEGMHEADPRMFEQLAGHDIATSLKCYQIISNDRKEKAVEKFLTIMNVQPDEEDDGKNNNVFYNVPQRILQRSKQGKENDRNDRQYSQTLKNKDLREQKKPSCNSLQEGTVPPRGVEPL